MCDKDRKQAQRLRELGSHHPSFRVYEGDVNEEIETILDEASIGPKTAGFCLIDQRTFECHWPTVQAVARHKAEGRKIELFYFLAQGWLDRAQSKASPEKLRAWWGNGDYRDFLCLRSFERANAICQRLRSELKYEYAMPFAIQQKGPSSRIMYYMVHASDHRRAAELMSQAYRTVRESRQSGGVQTELRW